MALEVTCERCKAGPDSPCVDADDRLLARPHCARISYFLLHRQFKAAINTAVDDQPVFDAFVRRFEVPKSTVRRWIGGISRPHPLFQRAMVAWLRDYVERR